MVNALCSFWLRLWVSYCNFIEILQLLSSVIYRPFVTWVSHLKISDFSGEILKVLECYNFLWVQRRHNCSPAASFANCDMTLYLLKVHLQTFLSIPITQKMPNFELWHFCRKWAICFWILSLFLDLSCVYFNIYTFGYQTGREKDLDDVVAGILRVQSAVSFFLNAVVTF